MDVAGWLRGLGLERYAEAFRENEIDAEVLPRLTAEDLVALGVSAVGHRRKLLDAIAALRDGTAPPDDQPAAAGPGAMASAAAPIPEGKRRQVTVLFADLAGYTRLSTELDAEELHALLGRFFATVDGIVEGYGGRVDKHVGDCVMAVFGAPVAHGNDPERAVRAALDIQARMPALGDELGRPLPVHIGIASGQVVASGTGSDSHREYTVTGESVNLASRLTDAATSGAILVSDAVHRALTDRLECAEVGELAIKGLTKPVRAWRLLALREVARSDRRQFVGRQGELRQFEAVLTACRGSGSGQAVYIRGEAGVGKTRLVEEFQAAAERAGFACHSGLVLDFGTGTGQDAIRALVRSLLDLPTGASDVAAGEPVAARALADGLVAADRRVYLNDLLDLPQPVELRALYDAMDNPTRNRGKRITVAELVARASGRQPRLLLVEDLHWADRVTLDYLATLAETVAECPALLVMTSRVEGDPLDHAWRSGIAGSPPTTIDLGPLPPQEAEALAGAYLDALGELARRCVERAAGNPLFLEQLLRHAEESAEAGIPGSIQSLVQARMDRLDPADKRALQAASVLGQRFDLDALGALLQGSDYDCTALVRHFLVRPQGEQFLFVHALIREGVYDSLLKSRRRELHRPAAAWFAGRESALHAQHLDRAEDPEAPRAYLEAACAQAAEYRTERALRLIERGLTLATARAAIYALTRFQGEVLHDLGAIPESIAAFERALAVADDDIERCRAWIGLVAGMRVTDRYDEAFAALDAAEAAATAHDLKAELARIHHARGNLCFPLGRLQECLREHELALDLAEKANAPELEARALGGLGDAEYARGRMASAYTAYSRCVMLCRAHGFGRIEVANLSMVAHAQIYLNDLRGALDTSHAAVELAAQVGHHRAEMIAHGAACNVLRTTGDFGRATPHAEHMLTLARRLGARRFEAVSLDDQAMAFRVEGRRAEALDLLRRALAIGRETGISFMGPSILGDLAATTDDPATRREALAEGEEILRGGSVGHNHLWFHRYAIEASLSAGEWDAAERYAAALEEYTRPEPLPWADFFIAYGRALAAHGHGRRDDAIVQELRRLRDEADRLGFRVALPALEQALGVG